MAARLIGFRGLLIRSSDSCARFAWVRPSGMRLIPFLALVWVLSVWLAPCACSVCHCRVSCVSLPPLFTSVPPLLTLRLLCTVPDRSIVFLNRSLRFTLRFQRCRAG